MGIIYAKEIADIFPPAKVFLTFSDLVNVIVRNAFVIAGLLSFLLLIFGGFSVIVGAGSGDSKQLEKGKDAMVGALIGLLVIFTSVWILQIVEKIIGYRLYIQ